MSSINNDLRRKLGSTGLDVFPLGFGGIPIQRVNEEKAAEVVKEAVRSGINFIDTARAYTDSEVKIGKALKDLDEKVHLASKSHAHSKEEILEDVDQSLGNLGVEKIDIYQLHGVNDEDDLEERVKKDGPLEGLQEARKQGKIENIGITGHRNDTLVKAIQKEDFDTVMFCYNFIENEAEQELMEVARKQNVGKLGMKPLAGGRLEKPKIALKYVLNQQGLVPIPGMRSIREVKENIKIAKEPWELTPEDEKTKKKIEDKLGTEFCRRCGYCKPCPQEINIPVVVRAESYINRLSPEGIKSDWLEYFEKAEDCTECEECVEKCPYNLPIPELMKENVKIMKEYMESV